MIELVCFDLDGTLVDSRRDIERSLEHALAQVPPADRDDEERDARALGAAGLGLSLEEFFAMARPRIEASAAATLRVRFVDAYRRHYHEHLLDDTRPFEGVVETLAALAPLRARGLRTAVATTKRSDTARRVVAGLRLDGYFDVVLGTDGIPHKPAPDVLLLAARTVERAPARGLMVGDNARDVQAGRAAGMRTCAVSYSVASPDELRAHAPDYVIDRFADVLAIINGQTNPKLV
jgi:phosphoglycolate phosphatase